MLEGGWNAAGTMLKRCWKDAGDAGDKLISRDFLRRQMPWDMNVTQEEEKVEVEELRDALMTAVANYASAIPQMASQGQDPSKAIAAIAAAIKGRQKGDNIEDVITEAFAQQVSPPVEAAGAQGQAPSGEPNLQGAPQGMPAGQPPQQGQSLQNLLAGLSSSAQPTSNSSNSDNVHHASLLSSVNRHRNM